MREANAKYPGNYRVMYYLAYAMNMEAFSVPDAEYQQNAYKEIISIGEKVVAECKDRSTQQGIIEVMCSAYSWLNEKEKAKKLIDENLGDLWRSREHMLNNVLDGEELIKHRRQTLNTLTELLSWEMYHLSRDLSPEERLAALENIIKIYSMVFSDGNYGYYHVKVLFFHTEALDICLGSGNNAKALEHLKSAAEHSIAFDSSPHLLTGLIINQKGNQSYNLLKNLSHEKCNIISETPEFIEIYENLKKYSREDG
jgi:hypothetical protein